MNNKSKIKASITLLTKILIGLSITLLIASCAHKRRQYPVGAITSFSELKHQFRDPSNEYITVPFFVWNGKITKPAIDSFLLDFRDAGCGGVFIHARPGLITSYLTDEWFGLFSYTVNKGKELGINVWIYDEYNFPSGFAGGNVPAEIEPVYILGNFSVVPADKGWKLKEPPESYTTKSWDEQGMPFYPWGVSYSKSFTIQNPADYYEIKLGKWKGTVSEITVNDEPAGIIAFPPYVLEVSNFIKKGKNKIVVTVIGSLKNLLGPHHNNPPKGMAISPYWRGVTSYPPGNEYQILDYGLYGNIQLYQSK